MKQWIPITLAVLLATGVVAGCSSGTTASPEAGKATADPSTTDDLKDKLELNIMAISYEGGGWPANNPMIDYLNKKFNVDLKFQWVSQDNYKEKMNVLAASGDFPDSFLLMKDDFLKWRDKGVFLDVKPFLSKYPNLAKQLGGEEQLQFMSPKGKYYSFPYYQIETQTSFGIRKDWLDKLNLKMPTTVDEFYDVTKAFAKQDPDGNGKNDTYGFSVSLAPNKTDFKHIDPIKAAFGLVNIWGVKDGKLISWHTQNKELKDFAVFLNKAYTEGVMDKDFAINKVKDPQDKYEAGKVGIDDVVPNVLYQTIVPNVKKIDPKAETVQLLPPKGPTGLQGTSTNSITQRIVINSKIDPKKQERLLKLFDYLVSDEGNILTKNGIEGVHYKKDGDKYTKLDAFDKDRPILISAWYLRRFDLNTQIRLWDDKKTADDVNQWFKNSEPFKWTNVAAGLESPTDVKSGATIDQKFMTALIKVIMGEQPIDSLDQAVEQWKKDGGDKITQEYNEAYQKSQQ
ncbi:ABC transporter substrate-binding protein [Paenibacillus anseongense]|uniref:ABC transporter substrate-binding protein n=1 Tax=Paenibacillus anseongense TaxID=2682845 RepID=UPI002DBD8777|nr:ABC transporter substrate-binding protein [Paenibacillus anseongense]MEC0270096.1 extracellular solute-binding protein [Paenibacillus anseongense]